MVQQSHDRIALGPVLLVWRATVAALVMLAATGLSWWFTPTHRMAAESPIALESMIPEAFGEWKVDAVSHAVVVNPQQTELLRRLYSQTLSRTYISQRGGERVMLSIAYGEDQRDSMQIHYPEVCYPAQGFELRSVADTSFSYGERAIPVRRLETRLRNRAEAVTYWTVVGSHVVRKGLSKKIAEVTYGLRGVVPDGLLVRVSTIGAESAQGFSVQEQFSRDLLDALTDDARQRLVGPGGPVSDSAS